MADPLPPSPEVLAGWRDVCDSRMTVEVGIAVLAAERAVEPMVDAQHRRLLAAIRLHDDTTAARVMTEHLRGTEYILAAAPEP